MVAHIGPQIEWSCKNCNVIHHTSPGRVGKFCDRQCNGKYVRKQTYKRFLKGEILHRKVLRSVLLEHRGSSCENCGLSTWMEEPLPLEVDHIDGNAGNNFPENVKLLCPNCHSVTPYWKGRNRGNGRKARNLPLN